MWLQATHKQPHPNQEVITFGNHLRAIHKLHRITEYIKHEQAVPIQKHAFSMRVAWIEIAFPCPLLSFFGLWERLGMHRHVTACMRNWGHCHHTAWESTSWVKVSFLLISERDVAQCQFTNQPESFLNLTCKRLTSKNRNVHFGDYSAWVIWISC